MKHSPVTHVHVNRKGGVNVGSLVALLSVLAVGLIAAAVVLLMQPRTATNPYVAMIPNGQPIEANIPELKGCNVISVDLGIDVQGNGPAERTKLRIYIPTGNHADGSLPCVVLPPMTVEYWHGSEFLDYDHGEASPYVQAGMIVIMYSQDGPLVDPIGQERENDSKVMIAGVAAYNAFRDSKASLANATKAVDFASSNLTIVDKSKIYAVGNGTSGSRALVLAANDQRIKGCVALAPVIDVTKHFSKVLKNSKITDKLEGFADFAKTSSPSEYLDMINCPVYFFHAEDDIQAAIEDSRSAAKTLEDRGVDVTTNFIPLGDHFQSVHAEGIPGSIQWLQTMGTK